jgi:hypothetical protein
MGKSEEKLRIFENVMARVGLSGDFLGEYFKALSTLNGLQTYSEMNPPMPPVSQNTAITPPIDQNQGAMPPLGGGGLNSPVMP